MYHRYDYIAIPPNYRFASQKQTPQSPPEEIRDSCHGKSAEDVEWKMDTRSDTSKINDNRGDEQEPADLATSEMSQKRGRRKMRHALMEMNPSRHANTMRELK